MTIQSLQIILVSFLAFIISSIGLAGITLGFTKKLKLPFIFFVLAILVLVSLIIFGVSFYNTVTQLGKYF
jgi:hypothetical protein